MNRTLKMVSQWVMAVLGIEKFATSADGSPELTAEQQQTLIGKYGQTFVEGFQRDLQASAQQLPEGQTLSQALDLNAEERLELEAGRIEAARMRSRIEALERAEADAQTLIGQLRREPAAECGSPADAAPMVGQAAQRPQVDLTLAHNRFLADYLSGRVGATYSGHDTIDTQELRQEFGRYVAQERLEIMRGLFGTTESTACMSSIVTDKTEVRASQASVVGTVLQQFVPEWTPSGAAKFTPLTIRNFKCKINVPIKPSDIMEDVLGWLYDEQAGQLQSMPVVRYILQQLIFPRLDEEREQALAVGEFKESEPDAEGRYTASSALASMDGYLTQLRRLYSAGSTAVRFLQKNVTITDANVLEVIDAAVEEIATKYPLYARKRMLVHADPNIVLKYQKAYRKKYPWLKNEDGDGRTRIDFSQFSFAPLEGMRGTGCFFITPKENFKHLMSHNPQNVTLRFVENHYSVDVLAEWWEGTGFWLAEAVFAYINPEWAAQAAGEGDPEGL